MTRGKARSEGLYSEVDKVKEHFRYNALLAETLELAGSPATTRIRIHHMAANVRPWNAQRVYTRYEESSCSNRNACFDLHGAPLAELVLRQCDFTR